MLKLPAFYMLLMFVYHAAYSRKTQVNSLWVVTKNGKTERLVKDLWMNKTLEKLNDSVFLIR